MRILIANRGEISARIAKTINKLGHTSLALEKLGIRNSPILSLANEIVYFKSEWEGLDQTYLNPDNIIKLALEHRVEAIHPGYGFLSESSEFAKLVESNNIIFIGPSSDTLKLLADKVQAKKVANKLNIPTIQGFDILDFNDENLKSAEVSAKKLGFPLMIKASFGGGGRGMRVVNSASEFLPLIHSASVEAKRAFGNGELFVEKLISKAQHVEIQIIGDKLGNCIHLFERDCSLQRRNQKLVEIAPCPNLENLLLEKLYQDSLKLGNESKLSNAATIEFLVDQQTSNYYFIESNPRLQVEHTITEEITGLDIVELQINSALGKALPRQNNIKKSGFAIQLRICAENSNKNFEPSTGTLEHISFPEHTRIEAGYLSGSNITTDYDSLIAKIITKGLTWNEARENAILALNNTAIKGIHSNISLLLQLLKFNEVIKYQANTTLIENTKLSTETKKEDILTLLSSINDSLYKIEETKSGHTNPFANRIKPNEILAKPFLISIPQLDYSDKIVIKNDSAVSLKHHTHIFENYRDLAFNQHISLMCNGYYVNCTTDLSNDSSEDSSLFDTGDLTAPLPCQIIEIYVENGNYVKKGDVLLSFESMKTEYTLTAPINGTITSLNISKNQKLNRGDLFLKLENTK